MICVSIGRGRHRMMIAEHRHLVEQGAQLVELRVDYILRSINLKRLLTDRPSSVVITCRREQDGGLWKGPEKERLMLLRSAVVEGADYIDLEEDIAGQIPRYGKTKRIISYHNFRETPDDLEAIHERITKLDADVVKIATMANHPADNLRVLRLMQQATVPTVAICMGDIGTPSRLLAGKYGAPFTYATFSHERTLAPGQLSYSQMMEIYHYDKINADTEIYGVIADPIAHSLSPVVHNVAFRHFKLNKVYLPFRVPREDLSDFLASADELGIKGLSVTIPHKEEVLPFLSQLDDAVYDIGAANTIVWDGALLCGFNTDFQAVMDIFDAAFGKLTGGDMLSGKTALVLGAGGVAKAFLYALKKRGYEVYIAARTKERAEDLAVKFDVKVVPWEDRITIPPHILINATPVGMHPDVDESPYDGDHLQRASVVFDSVYNPEQTLLVKQAREKGCRVITGVDMFIRQAALQFKLFTNHEAPSDVMRNELKKIIGAARS